MCICAVARSLIVSVFMLLCICITCCLCCVVAVVLVVVACTHCYFQLHLVILFICKMLWLHWCCTWSCLGSGHSLLPCCSLITGLVLGTLQYWDVSVCLCSSLTLLLSGRHLMFVALIFIGTGCCFCEVVSVTCVLVIVCLVVLYLYTAVCVLHWHLIHLHLYLVIIDGSVVFSETCSSHCSICHCLIKFWIVQYGP